ncbi:FecR family protein [Tenacibaculum caenipelagi]|uniref:FecR family protein n=1 Tax=Tenacibaculum caenipelagi TaxID=1325435 RepID=A0A4R6TFQ8_9FLAO|nr:FecR family protein [Tenacibaculum caenipelagi]TDQ27546.1 FecR family protein [Tenacibaculum caenipelagi]
MKIDYTDETFLARWIANELSSEELKAFQQSDAYHQFKAIDEASLLLKVPDYNQKEAFNKIQERLSSQKQDKKVIKLIPAWMYGAVASIALLISLFYFNNSTTISTTYGEQITITLPDNSIVHLSPNTTIKYKEHNWNKRRNLSLDGKAFFEVEKGKSFTVNTEEGNVTVLGTKFTVDASKNYFEVLCFEGKVKTTSKNSDETILTKGKAYRTYNNVSENWDFINSSPSWLLGETTFNNTPLYQVIKALENQFNLKFDTSKIDLNQRFTGTFTHEDVNIALKTVFAPMKISYKLAKNSSVILTYRK